MLTNLTDRDEVSQIGSTIRNVNLGQPLKAGLTFGLIFGLTMAVVRLLLSMIGDGPVDWSGGIVSGIAGGVTYGLLTFWRERKKLGTTDRPS